MRLCILCGQRPAEVPDRERMGKPIKRVCTKCHRERLAYDLAVICREHMRREAKKEAGR
jgi:hypothetical protein